MALADNPWLRARASLPSTWKTLLGVGIIMAVAVGAVATRSSRQGPASDPAAEGPVAQAAESAAVQAGAADGSADEPAAGEEGATAAALAGDDEGGVAAIPAPEPEPIDWVAATEPSPVEPVPASERSPRPRAVRGIYIGAWSAGHPDRLERLIRLADETEVNAFVIDIKDVTGEVSYATRVPLAVQLGANRQRKIGDVRSLLTRLREHGIYTIARIVVFKDPLLAQARPEWSIMDEDGSIWEDNKGVHWVDSYNRNVWDYNIELAREAVALGFSEVQWDYVRFPDAPSSYMARAVYPARDGRSRTEGIREFMMYSQERLADLDVPVTADVFGITTSAYNDVGIGQLWEEMADVMDVLLPMVYPSHYPRGSWGFPNPNAAPYQIVKKAMDHGVSRSREIDDPAIIRPWLQAFSLGQPPYGPREIRAQIDAVYDAGLEEWILWDPAVRYPREAFASADGREPWFAGLGADLYTPPSEAADEDDEGHGEGPAGRPVPGAGASPGSVGHR